MEPYPDGSWYVADKRVSGRFPLVCRGNVGEVFPNVMSPITASMVGGSFAVGQHRLALEAGLITPGQLDELVADGSAITPVFAGYLYFNVSVARTAVSRMPGLTVDLVDRQMAGLSGAPPHRRGPGDRSPRAALRGTRFMISLVIRPDPQRLDRTRRFVDETLAAAPSVAGATDDELIAVLRSVDGANERLMYELLRASTGAGVARSLLERAVSSLGGDGLVNQLTAGLGTIESAEPAADLWRLGRLAAESAELTAMFDAGLADLPGRLRRSPSADATGFVAALDAFVARHGTRGPEEWELARPTWGTDPTIALAAVDRLRRAPAERDPVAMARRLAATRQEATAQTRAALPWHRRRMFDAALRATTIYSAQREGTKAAFVRLLDLPRRVLVELARRSDISHDDLCLLTVDEIPSAMTDSAPFTDVVAERRARRDELQALVPPFWFMGEIPAPSTWERRADQIRPDATARRLTGLGVCSGVATGPARVITDPADPGALQPDEILVAPITDPSWTPLFLAAAGVVVDVGAQQSHAAIVARELGIPAVVSVAGASTTIPDGTIITVDGTNGHVTVHA